MSWLSIFGAVACGCFGAFCVLNVGATLWLMILDPSKYTPKKAYGDVMLNLVLFCASLTTVIWLLKSA